MIDIWYPLREARPDPDPLRYSLRSLKHLSNVGRVLLVGGLPEWVNPQAVVHIETVQDAGKFTNIGRNLLAVLEEDLTNPFLAMNDDQFILKRWKPTPCTRLRMMDDFVNSLRMVGARDHDDYVRGMRSQRDIMKAWGHDTSRIRCPDSHWPMPVDPDRLRDVLKRVQDEYPDHELGHFKGVYAAGLKLTETMDCKIQTARDRIPNLPVVSSSPGSWRTQAGRELRQMFDEPSEYERD